MGAVNFPRKFSFWVSLPIAYRRIPLWATELFSEQTNARTEFAFDLKHSISCIELSIESSNESARRTSAMNFFDPSQVEILKFSFLLRFFKSKELWGNSYQLDSIKQLDSSGSQFKNCFKLWSTFSTEDLSWAASSGNFERRLIHRIRLLKLVKCCCFENITNNIQNF